MIAMTGEEKAGLLLLSLDPEVARAVLARLGPDARGRLTAHMDRLAASPQREEYLSQVLQEAEKLLEQPQLRLVTPPEPSPKPAAAAEPKPEPARRTPAAAAAPATPAAPAVSVAPAAQAAAKPAPAEPKPEPSVRLAALPEDDSPHDSGAVDPNDPAAGLNALSDEQLCHALRGESSRTVALVLNQLSVDKAGAVYKQLPPEVRRETAVQMGTGTPPPPEILRRTVQAVLAKAAALSEVSGATSADARYKRMAELLRQLERPDRNDAIAALQERDPAVAAEVLGQLYSFDDILYLDGRSIQKVLGEIDSKTLSTSLKGASEQLKAKVIDNMSKRARDGLSEEMEFLGNVPATQIQQAQKAIVEVIQRLDQAGELVILR